MKAVLLATITTVLIVLLVAGVVRLVARLKNVQITYVDALVFLSIILFLLIGIVGYGEIPDTVALVIFFIFFSLGVAVVWLVIQALIFVPRVEQVIRRGWIKIWPQMIVRRKINKAVLDHAQAVTRMNLPLAEGFYLAGQQTPGRSGVVLQAMATFLHQGLKLSEAYSRYNACNALVLSMMQAGERCGQLPKTLEYLQDYFDREQKQRQRWIPVWWPYPLTMVAFAFLVVMFVMVVVVPKFETIFKDFGTTLPYITQILISASNYVVCSSPPIWLVLSVLVGVVMYLRLRPRRYPEPRLFERFTDYLVWLIPGLRTQREYTDLAHAAAILRLALGSGMTMPEAAQCAADLDLHTVLRGRFRQFHDLLAKGEPTDQAGEKVHLPTRFLWALRSGQNRETLESSLELIEKYYSLVASHWSATLNALVWPVVVVGLGLLIGFIDLALFMPLVKLITTTINAI